MKDIDFSAARVLVVGDVMLDTYLHGSTARISPEAPVPVVHVTREETRVGGAGNVALNVVALGARCSLLSVVGDDAAAGQIERMLDERGVRCMLRRAPSCRTTTKQRIISRQQQLIRLDFEDPFPTADAAALLPRFESALADCDIVVLSDYAKGSLQHAGALIAAARRCGVPVVVDPKGVEFERYRGATMLTPNVAELEAVVGACAGEAALIDRGAALRDRLEIDALLVTRSEKGMTLLRRDRPPLHLPTRAQEVYDVTGAGDTVVATLAAALAVHYAVDQAVMLSNAAAGIVVAKLGTATVSVSELRRALRDSSPAAERGEHTAAELLALRRMARETGETVVMTNGCFDILHPGHIDYLEKARALGDRLIVAVNDDASVRRLKGASRPVNPLATRLRMLSALSCVDWVVAFAEDTPERLICSLLPDILVKGGDYVPEQVAGAACVRAAGGSVRVLDFLAGHSTSRLIEQIQGSHA